MNRYEGPGRLNSWVVIQKSGPDLVLEFSRSTPFWTLGRDEDGFYLTFDGTADRFRIASPGQTLMVAWRLGMPGPKTANDVGAILAEKEKAEIEAVNFLQTKVGARGPVA